jgi:hypothetical protein
MSQLREYGPQSLPPFMYQHEGWTVEFATMPKSEKLRGQASVRTLGIQYGSGFERAKTAEAVKTALGNKIKKYGKLDLVAVNASAAFGDGFSIREALFGSEVFIVDDEDEAGGVLTRKQDAAPRRFWSQPELTVSVRGCCLTGKRLHMAWKSARRKAAISMPYEALARVPPRRPRSFFSHS